MRRITFVVFALVLPFLAANSSSALEKTVGRLLDEDRTNGWNAGTSCTIAYYNFCTGWVWIWSGWSSGDQVGVCFESCCYSNNETLVASALFAWTGAPAGYGFTGTIEVNDVEGDCCKGNLLGAQSYLPTSGWNTYVWGVNVGLRFVIQVRHGSSALPNPTAYASDHPAAGPTGPVACGTCYPTTRENHSFYYGNANSPLCPGSPLNDGVCDAQLLFSAAMVCDGMPVERKTWGGVKSLYR